ncbi:TetR/AcrR family transcriptional regulator [Virgibacillus sp. MSP4-1]|uniref:TetR/AcrR family transcriptional regulator n=1 Tax=Virgibacillus sp. MSP4-1 TaxID=2700081 RepID=UPI0003A974C0|nr:TetR/AcrR family transcriptional regulator [Virgibacillus sp. MSP4-1]QHS23755.1 TetR/AcrR family transcriptional regulator [Virgibacillus sp. MSP4-1]
MYNQLITPQKYRTKKHLQQALIYLTKEKGFQSVSVKDIVQYAGYNRSTFYVHYQDKFDLARDLLNTVLQGLEQSVEVPYHSKRKVDTEQLNQNSFQIISYIYDNRNFFELITCEDTIPELHTKFPQTILKIYQQKFEFKTLYHLPVDMEYFTRYTAYGFYGLISMWIHSGFEIPQEEFIDEIIKLARTHMASVRYLG